MATKPTDRFDSVPDDLLRTGAHRAAPRKGRGWIAFAWAALATGVLVAAGIFGLAAIRGTVNLPFAGPNPTATATPTATTTPTPKATTPAPAPTLASKIDPALPITILNGTTKKGLAAAAGDNLVAQGWKGAATGIGSRANASASNITKTVVFYTTAANEAAARGMVQSLKVGTIQLSSAYPKSPLTVLLGSDYVVPAG